MWAPSLKKTSCCHPVGNPFHFVCPVQMIVFCGISTPKQYIGLMNQRATKDFMSENGRQMVITSLLKGIRTLPFGTLVQGPLSQSSTSVELSYWTDCAFLRTEDVSLQLMSA